MKQLGVQMEAVLAEVETGLSVRYPEAEMGVEMEEGLLLTGADEDLSVGDLEAETGTK